MMDNVASWESLTYFWKCVKEDEFYKHHYENYFRSLNAVMSDELCILVHSHRKFHQLIQK